MYTLYITVLGAIFGAARAEEPSLITDRPDIAESSRAVGRGVVQLEQGVSLGLPSGLELGLNGGGTFAGAGLEGPVGLWAAALGRSVTDSLRLYGEASGEHGAGAHAVRLDAGGALLLSPDVQLDASGLVGVLGGGWAAGLGLSVRWD